MLLWGFFYRKKAVGLPVFPPKTCFFSFTWRLAVQNLLLSSVNSLFRSDRSRLKWFWSSVKLCSSTYDNKWQAAHLVGLLNLFEINNVVSEGIVYQKVWKDTTQLKTVPYKETIESFYFNGSGKMKSSFKKKSRIPSERAKKTYWRICHTSYESSWNYLNCTSESTRSLCLGCLPINLKSSTR